MKVFQIIDGECHWDATDKFPTVESTIGYFPESCVFVEAPDCVEEGWIYQDGVFLEPEPVQETYSAEDALRIMIGG